MGFFLFFNSSVDLAILILTSLMDPSGEALAGDGKQRKAGAAEGKSRRALGDIGNLVTVRGVEGKPQPQISRPVTRFVCLSVMWKKASVSVFVPFVDFFPLLLLQEFLRPITCKCTSSCSS